MTIWLSTLRRWALPGLLSGLLACQAAPAETELLQLYLLDDELAGINDNIDKANEGAKKSIEAMVAKNRNQPSDVAVLNQAVAVRAETRQLAAHLRELRQALTAGKAAPSAELLADRRRVAAALLSGGRADSLQQRLSSYAADMQRYLGRPPAPLVGVGGADPQVQAMAGAEQAGQSFTDLYFREATVAEASAALAQQEARVLRLESDVLANLSRRLSNTIIGFDQINAFASAESNVVAEGETYRAELFLVASSSTLRAQMTANGQPVPIGRDGKGQVRFTAPLLPPGRSRQSAIWEGTVAIRTNGRDSTFRIRVPYTIVRRR